MILSDIATIYDCPHSTAPDEGEGYALIRTPNVGKGRLILDDVHRVSKEVYDLRNKRAVPQEDDIIFAREAPAGNAAIITKEQKVCLGQRTVLIKPNRSLVNAHYLVYYLLAPQQQIRLLGYSHGATVGHVNIPDIANLPIGLPSILVQTRIASIIESYENLIEVNNKRIKVLEQMAENLYKEWFVRFRFPGHETAEFENGYPKGWAELKLEQFGVSLDSGSRPSGGVDDALTEGMPSLGAEAVNGLGEFDYNNVRLIPFGYYKKMTRGKNTGRDILVYKDGAYIGKTTIFMNGFPYENYAVNEHVFLLNALDADYQLYLYFTLHQAEYYTLMQNLNRNAAQPGLSKQDMNRIKIAVPTKERVAAFNAIVESILNQIFILAIQKQNLIKQRDLLLPRLMSGKLEV